MNEEKIPMKISLISSSFSGILHILLGYPFDTIKSIMQKNPNKFNSSTLRDIFKLLVEG